MTLTETQRKMMHLGDSIRACGKAAVEEFNQLCRERGIEDLFFCAIRDYTDQHVEIAQKVHDNWHTTKNFKVGDKVYVVPLTHTLMETCIRARVIEVGNDGWGYRLRAFENDLPGIYMFNMWDKDLIPRVGKKVMPTPPEKKI